MNNKNYKKLLLIDLDGVLNEYKGDYDPGFIPPIKKGAKEFLENLSINYKIKIFTTRNRLLASKWLIKNDLDTFTFDITNVKEPAYIYIDDRCICFSGNFEDALKEIENFTTYWKN